MSIYTRVLGWFMNILNVLIPVVAILIIAGMLTETQMALQTGDIDTASSVIWRYLETSLTLFGFTLVGAIFEQNRQKTDILLKLFKICIGFLVSSISFLLLVSFIRLSSKDIFLGMFFGGTLYVVLWVIASLSFAYGILLLLYYLIGYLRDISYTDNNSG